MKTTKREPRQITDVFASAWAPVFDNKPSNIPEAESYLSRFQGSYDWSFAIRPGLPDLPWFLALAPDSASGPDGLPFSAWTESGLERAKTLNAVLQDLLNDIPMPITFNDSVSLFLGKGEIDGDNDEHI